jgi:hypothetical protein
MYNVHVRVTDSATGKPTPVRIRFSDEHGNYYPPLGRPRDFPIARSEAVGDHVYIGGNRYAYIDGGSEFPLPASVPLTVEISKGPEYLPLRQTVTLGPGQIALRFTINRWTDPSETPPVAVDSRGHFVPPHSARLEAAAEGLDLVNLLVCEQEFPSTDGHLYRLYPNMAAFSGQEPALPSVYVNTFNSHPVLGRLGLLHSHRAVFPITFGLPDATDDWSLADWCEQCHRKKGLVVWCDPFRTEAALVGSGEALVQAVLGRIDAIEIDAGDRPQPFLPRWYRLLNVGVFLPLVGGSGKDSNRVPLGSVRTLTPGKSEGETSYTEWVEQVRQGQSTASNGPLLRFWVDDQPFTKRVQRGDDTPILLRAEALSAEPFDRLEILFNGKPIATAIPSSEAPFTARVGHEFIPPGNGWLAARCWGKGKSTLYPGQPIFAHTSAVAVEKVGSGDGRDRDAMAAIVRDIEQVRDWVEREGQFANPKRQQTLLDYCALAIERMS